MTKSNLEKEAKKELIEKYNFSEKDAETMISAIKKCAKLLIKITLKEIEKSSGK